MRLFLSILLALNTFFANMAMGNDLITGAITYVVDGDTFGIGRQRYRVWGIDAPETHTPEGMKARAWAIKTWEGKPVLCQKIAMDRYRRVVARCSINGIDIAKQILKAGHACEWKKYSKGYYGMKETCESRGQR